MRAEDRRRQLLEVAAEEFARHGYRGCTTAQLAKAAGITEPILYRHFKSKLELFVTLIETVGDEVIGTWKKYLDRAKTPRDKLNVLLAGNPATHERGRGIYRVIFKAMTEQEANDTIADALRRHVSQLHSFLTAQVENLQREGVVRSDEPAEAMALLLVEVAAGHGILKPLSLGGVARIPAMTDTRYLVGDLLKDSSQRVAAAIPLAAGQSAG
jgi:AcrR family transcriptional regulator